MHLDDNLRAELSRAPLFVSPASHNDLLMALWEDTAFLSRLDVMDYSLLVRDVQERFRCRYRYKDRESGMLWTRTRGEGQGVGLQRNLWVSACGLHAVRVRSVQVRFGRSRRPESALLRTGRTHIYRTSSPCHAATRYGVGQFAGVFS